MTLASPTRTILSTSLAFFLSLWIRANSTFSLPNQKCSTTFFFAKNSNFHVKYSQKTFRELRRKFFFFFFFFRFVLSKWQVWNLPQCAHFPTDICSVIQEGEITVEKCAHRSASARRELHTLSHGRNKHGHNNSAPFIHLSAIAVTRLAPPASGLK